ncbi:MAG TPA: uracil-DNA glycosylase [Pseudomonadales bacterium]
MRYDRLESCRICPRLAAHLDQVRQAHPGYRCLPVGATGSVRAKLLMVGLAPGLHGANRTGRPFTGDASGTFLFAALARVGLASDADPLVARLVGARLTNAVKCLPPQNRPNAAEMSACSRYLREEIDELWSPKVRSARCVLCLGRLAHRSVEIALGKRLPAFLHGQLCEVKPGLWLADSYHPSRQNTNTRRLTPEMLDSVLENVKGVVGLTG